MTRKKCGRNRSWKVKRHYTATTVTEKIITNPFRGVGLQIPNEDWFSV
jgi:hypothetical protein